MTYIINVSNLEKFFVGYHDEWVSSRDFSYDALLFSDDAMGDQAAASNHSSSHAARPSTSPALLISKMQAASLRREHAGDYILAYRKT